MFITPEEARARFASPDNLANCFDINKAKKAREERLNAENAQSGIPETQDAAPISGFEEPESKGFESLPAGTESVGGIGDRISHERLRTPGNRRPWLSATERTEIAISAKTSGIDGPRKTQEEIAQEHGISRIAVAKIKAGNGLVDEIAVEEALERARNKALDRLMTSLGFLSDDKISALDAKGISHVAANMARVVEKTMPKQEVQQPVQIVIYSPEPKQEKSFDVVEI
jgi:hypothetical protein